MWEEIFNLALSNGLWSAMFLGLLIYQLKDSAKREKKYQDTIVDLTKNLGIVQIIKSEVQEIKDLVNKITTKKTIKNFSKWLTNDKNYVIIFIEKGATDDGCLTRFI